MLTYRLESTTDDMSFNKLICFDSVSGNIDVIKTNPFLLTNLKEKDIFDKFNIVKEENSRLIINEKVKDGYSFPFKLYIDITDKCQLNCKHCLTKRLNLNNELGIDIIKDIIKECEEHGLFYVKLGGGEPLLHPNIFEIIKRFHDAGVYISMSTNAFLINEKVADFFKKYNVKVSVSLEGPKEINDRIRGKNHFEVALKAVDLLKKRGVNTCIRVTLTRYMLDIDKMKYMINLAKEKNVKLKVSYCRPAGSAIDNDLLIRYDDYNKYKDVINLLNKEEYKDLISMDEGMMLDQPEGLIDYLYKDKICGAANRSFHINSKGKVSPCVFLGEDFLEKDSCYSYGDILKYWNESKGSFIRKVRNIKIPKACTSCDRLCKLECSATRYYFNKGFEINDPNCLKGAKKCLKLK